MAERVCPPWVGFLLLNPFRKLWESPAKLLGPFVSKGMTVLEPGPGMGFFTLPLARLVGPKGRVIVVEVQDKMLQALERRAKKAGLLERIELRRVEGPGLGVEDLFGQVDFAAVLHVVHEVPDPVAFLRDAFLALKPGGHLLIVEPKGHVSQEEFQQTLTTAKTIGFASEALPQKVSGRGALLSKPG